MQEKYYLLDPNGGKIGPADIVELTRWARDGRLLPENTICDDYGNTCNARDVISFIKIPENTVQPVNATGFYIAIIILTLITCVSVISYLGLRINYDKLSSEHIKLKQDYENIEKNVSELEKRNEQVQKEATDFIGNLVKKYNIMEKEKDNLTDQIGSLQEENKSLKDIRNTIKDQEKKLNELPVSVSSSEEE